MKKLKILLHELMVTAFKLLFVKNFAYFRENFSIFKLEKSDSVFFI
jgi:hypothetical protein